MKLLLINNTTSNQRAVRKLRFKNASVLTGNVKGSCLMNKQNAPSLTN
jgi:hypothetical protein